MLRPSRDWRESITLSSREPHFGQRIVSEHSVSHNNLWRQCGMTIARIRIRRRGTSSPTKTGRGPVFLRLRKAALRCSSFGRGNFFLWPRLFFFELETNFSVFQFQISGKGASFFRNKLVQKIGFSGRNQFLHLFFWNFAMQNVFANAKVDRKSTRLNSSHMSISYAVFCLKKKITMAGQAESSSNRALVRRVWRSQWD